MKKKKTVNFGDIIWLQDLSFFQLFNFSPYYLATSSLHFIASLPHHLVSWSPRIALSLSLLRLSPRPALQFIITIISLHNQLALPVITSRHNLSP